MQTSRSEGQTRHPEPRYDAGNSTVQRQQANGQPQQAAATSTAASHGNRQPPTHNTRGRTHDFLEDALDDERVHHARDVADRELALLAETVPCHSRASKAGSPQFVHQAELLLQIQLRFHHAEMATRGAQDEDAAFPSVRIEAQPQHPATEARTRTRLDGWSYRRPPPANSWWRWRCRLRDTPARDGVGVNR